VEGYWNQKLDFTLQDTTWFTLRDFWILLTFNNALPNDTIFKSSSLELIFFINLGEFPLLLPPPSLANWKFLGYYSIFFVSSGIALFGSPNCPQTTLDNVQLLLLPHKVFFCINCWVIKKNFSWLRLRENSSRNYWELPLVYIGGLLCTSYWIG
jgi:hypothetical protein